VAAATRTKPRSRRRAALAWGASIALVAGLLAAGAFRWAKPRPAPVAGGAAAGAVGVRLAPLAGRAGVPGACAVAGMVQTWDGRPVSGAMVAALDLHEASGQLAEVAAADGDGRFCLSVAPGWYRLSAQAAGLLPAVRRLLIPSTGPVVLVLVPGGQMLSGRVLDAGGGPIAGARVQTAVDGGPKDRPGSGTIVAITATDGAYRLTVAPGTHVFTVEADGYARLRRPLQIIGDQTHDFRLLPAASVAGRVVAQAGQAIAGALVRIGFDAGRSGPGETTSDGSGGFSFGSLEPGVYDVVARHGPLAGRLPVPITVTLGAHIDGLILEVKPGRTLSGQVRGPAGALPRALVRLYGGGMPAGESGGVRTDAAGAFRFEGVLPGTFYVSATADGLLPAGRRIVVLAEDVAGIELTMKQAARVEGVVLDRAGRPVAGAEVEASSILRGAKEDESDSVRSDGQGRFRVDNVAPGSVTVEAAHPDQGSGFAGPFALGPGDRKEVTVRLAGGHHVSGRVRWQDGALAAAVAISASGWGDHPGGALTDGDGRYRVGPFPPGTIVIVGVSLAADEENGPHRGFTMPPRDVTGIDFIVPRATGTIRGLVLGPSGEPLGGAIVHTESGSDDGRVVTGEDGTFLLDGLLERSYTVVAGYAGRPAAVLTGVSPGSAPVRLQIEAGATLAGLAVRDDGLPAGEYLLRATRGRSDEPSRGDKAVSVPPGDGAFELTGLTSGVYDLVAAARDGRSGGLEGIAVAAGASRRGLRLILGQGARLSGRLVDWETDAPIAGALVHAEAAGRAVSTPAEADGRFRLDGLPAGIGVDLSVEAAGYEPPERSVTIPAGQVSHDLGTVPLVKASRLALGRDTKGKVGIILTVDADGAMLIRDAPEGLPAAAAGLRAGDLIVRIAGRDVRKPGPLTGGRILGRRARNVGRHRGAPGRTETDSARDPDLTVWRRSFAAVPKARAWLTEDALSDIRQCIKHGASHSPRALPDPLRELVRFPFLGAALAPLRLLRRRRGRRGRVPDGLGVPFSVPAIGCGEHDAAR
jgi:Carboxypeptidase regulatory-like domain